MNAGNKQKSTPLFWALYDEAKVRMLLDGGANVNARISDGRTPLYRFQYGEAVPVMRLLLEKGADPNAKTLTGMTPLIAASRSNLDAMRLLIEKKADVTRRMPQVGPR